MNTVLSEGCVIYVFIEYVAKNYENASLISLQERCMRDRIPRKYVEGKNTYEHGYS